ncbi:MAG: sigma-54-dependent Fis family transcriptional regulator, partial [Desulfovibrionaceae bacterium]|nr:sigma-54-dependent Fis family transcriptional regulator [Desulfovibrionaceae bacterium]
PVIMISGHGNIEIAVAAIREGAHDFIEKPLSLEKIVLAVNRTLEFVLLRRENASLRASQGDSPLALDGSSAAISEVKSQIAQVAPTEAWVLITGDNGTGKEIAARSIYAQSNRSQELFVAVNCAAIPEELIESELFGHEKGAFTGAESARPGKFELAHQGTLFLDEIGDMSLKTQAKILRILQEREFERVGGSHTIRVDVRVIAATNKNMEEEIAAGRFREDLYYRLNVFPLRLPPLKKRGQDILLLAGLFENDLVTRHGFKPLLLSEGARQAMLSYEWPGNVRELRNFIERMLILHSGKELRLEHLPQEMRMASGAASLNSSQFTPKAQPSGSDIGNELNKALEINDLRLARQEFESAYLKIKLSRCNGNISRLAELIGVERSHLSRKLKMLGVQPGE